MRSQNKLLDQKADRSEVESLGTAQALKSRVPFSTVSLIPKGLGVVRAKMARASNEWVCIVAELQAEAGDDCIIQ